MKDDGWLSTHPRTASFMFSVSFAPAVNQSIFAVNAANEAQVLAILNSFDNTKGSTG